MASPSTQAAGGRPARTMPPRQFASGGDDTDDVPDQVQLLLDIRDAFGDEIAITTSTLLGRLNDLDESPWGARRKGEGLDARGLARMLRPFKVKPRSVRAEGGRRGTGSSSSTTPSPGTSQKRHKRHKRHNSHQEQAQMCRIARPHPAHDRHERHK